MKKLQSVSVSAVFCSIIMFPASLSAAAQQDKGWGNRPCSQDKGGIDRCIGEIFVCKDGSVSRSKKICPAYRGGKYAVEVKDWVESANEDCSCAQGKYCVSPHESKYCLDNAGDKSYFLKGRPRKSAVS